MDRKPTPKTGIARIWAAFFYSLHGLGFAILNETAFRHEFFIEAVPLIVLLFLPLSFLWKGLLFFAFILVLIVEMLNLAIEAVVDMASPEYHILEKRAKDFGSAAGFGQHRFGNRIVVRRNLNNVSQGVAWNNGILE